jgi:hypothetical protein
MKSLASDQIIAFSWKNTVVIFDLFDYNAEEQLKHLAILYSHALSRYIFTTDIYLQL